MYAFEPQLVLMAVGLFFTVIGATWVVWKTISDLRADTHRSQAEMIKSFGELKVDTAKSISESQAKTEKSFGELRADTHRSQAEMIKSFGELKADTTQSFGEVRVDIKGLGTRMDCLDKHMDARMNSLEGQVRDMGGEVRGINEFLRRESVKDIESDKES